jgi:hypothetical protein
MRALSLDQAKDVFETTDLASHIGGIDWQYPGPVPNYLLPKDSGAKIGLARAIANTFLDRGPTVLWITEVGIWPSAEQMDLFTRYRLSYGESRTIAEAPVQIFEVADRKELTSILCLGLFFVWGLEVMNLDRSLAITVSHDEWIEYRFAPGNDALIQYFEKHFDWMSTKGK